MTDDFKEDLVEKIILQVNFKQELKIGLIVKLRCLIQTIDDNTHIKIDDCVELREIVDGNLPFLPWYNNPTITTVPLSILQKIDENGNYIMNANKFQQTPLRIFYKYEIVGKIV